MFMSCQPTFLLNPAMLSKTILPTTRPVPRLLGLALLTLALTPAAWADTYSQTTAGTYNWVCPSGVSKVTIACRGGGGGSARDLSCNRLTS
jgi:hypothetical protein